MRLLLLRHGVAEDAGPATGHRDEPRALTHAGAARMRVQARGMAALGIAPEAVLTSPLTRCVQTTAIVCEALGGTPREDRRLRPGMALDQVADLLLELPGVGSVLLCGHQPDLSALVRDLTRGGLVDFRRGTLAALDVEEPRPGGGRLRALYPPAALRVLGA